MRTYTEEDLRRLSNLIDEHYRPYTRNNIEGADVVENFIKGYYDKKEEERIDFTYGFLRRKLEWTEFCDLTGVGYYAKNEGYEIKDTDTFSITESKAKEYGLL